MSKSKGFSITSAGRYSLALYELASESKLLAEVENLKITRTTILVCSQKQLWKCAQDRSLKIVEWL